MGSSRRPTGRRIKTGPPPVEAPDFGVDPLYAVFRNGRRVYLRGDRPGLPVEIAEAQARALGGYPEVEIRRVYGGQE